MRKWLLNKIKKKYYKIYNYYSNKELTNKINTSNYNIWNHNSIQKIINFMESIRKMFLI